MTNLKPRKLKDSIIKKIELRNKISVKDGDFCEKCNSKESLTLEHIVPFWFLKDNLNYNLKASYKDEWNFKILCQMCNSEKSHKIDFKDKRTREIFLRYLNLIPMYESN